MVKQLPLERLLLETDSPFFIPKDVNKLKYFLLNFKYRNKIKIKHFFSFSFKFPYGLKVSHPGFVFATAESIAYIKNISVNRVLIANRSNIKKIYSF